MRVVSPLLKRVVYPCLAGAGYFRSLNHSGLAVVTYHGVVPPNYRRIDPGLDGSLVTPETFRRQLRLLKSNYNVISPEEMLAWCRKESDLPPRAVLITCDDGLHSNVTQMLPILREEDVRCLFFVTGASAGNEAKILWYMRLLHLLLRAPGGKFRVSTSDFSFSGVLGSPKHRRALCGSMLKRLSRIRPDARENFLCEAHSYFGSQTGLEAYELEIQRHFGLMTKAEVQQLAAAGMTIGAHTLTHPVLSEQPLELAWTEIAGSRALLESVLGRTVWAFAYPFGGANSISTEVVAMTRRSGFSAAFTNVGGGFGAGLPLHAIPRVHVTADMTKAEFEARVSGFHETLQRVWGHASANSFTADLDSKYIAPNQDCISKEQRAG